MAQNQKSYDNEFKAQVVKFAQEIGGHKAANELGIPKGTMYTWIKVFKEGRLSANEAAYGWRRCSTYRNHTCSITFRLILNQVWIVGQGNPCPGGKEEIIEQHNSADY